MTLAGEIVRTGDIEAMIPPMYGTTVSITPSAANTPTSQAVAFPAGRFSTAPTVVLTPMSAVPGSQVTGVAVTAITTAGCTVWLTRTNTTTTIVHLLAVEAS